MVKRPMSLSAVSWTWWPPRNKGKKWEAPSHLGDQLSWGHPWSDRALIFQQRWQSVDKCFGSIQITLFARERTSLASFQIWRRLTAMQRAGSSSSKTVVSWCLFKMAFISPSLCNFGLTLYKNNIKVVQLQNALAHFSSFKLHAIACCICKHSEPSSPELLPLSLDARRSIKVLFKKQN